MQRSALMARVRRSGTTPELAVWKAARSLGFEFERNRSDLPGSPDLVFPAVRLCVFVHGCFWHRHPGCRRASTPSSNRDFWVLKFQANVARDRRARRKLRALGWRTLVIWECRTKEAATIERRLRSTVLTLLPANDGR
jgi:DNA mismatch endonuclease (patch repair protein)